MPQELLLLGARYIALFGLVVSILLIFVRWRFPKSSSPSKKAPSHWREFWKAYRKGQARVREHDRDLRAIRGKSGAGRGPRREKLQGADVEAGAARVQGHEEPGRASRLWRFVRECPERPATLRQAQDAPHFVDVVIWMRCCRIFRRWILR